MVSPETDLKTKFGMPFVSSRLTRVRGKRQKRIGQTGKLNCEADQQSQQNGVGSSGVSITMRAACIQPRWPGFHLTWLPWEDVTSAKHLFADEADAEGGELQAVCQPQFLQLSTKTSSAKDLGTTSLCLLPCV